MMRIPVSPAAYLKDLAASFAPQKAKEALKRFGEYLSRSDSMDAIRNLASQFQNILELPLMETVKSVTSQLPENHPNRQALEDWRELLERPISAGIEGRSLAQVCCSIAFLSSISNYLERRDVLLMSIQALPKNQREEAARALHKKLTELLIHITLPSLIEDGRNPLLRHQYRLWSQVTDCIAAGAEEFAMFFLVYDGERLRFLGPWVLSGDADVQELYQCANIIATLARQGVYWDHDVLVNCFWQLLDLKARILLSQDRAPNQDDQAVLELWAMVYWTERKEFHSFWELSRFYENLSRYELKEEKED